MPCALISLPTFPFKNYRSCLKLDMSDKSGSASEGEGDEIRPYGEDRDSSEESEDDDPEEAKRIAEGFIVDEDEEDGEGEDDEEDEEARRRRRKEEKRRRKKERRMRREREEAELSEDELELIEENRGLREGRPLKRLRRRSGSDGSENDRAVPTLQDMFRDDEDRMEDDDDDLMDFIEEDEEDEANQGETEEQRRERKRAEKLKRREQARSRPELTGVDRSWVVQISLAGSKELIVWQFMG